MIWVWRIWRVFLGLIFISAGWSKIGPLPDHFAEILSVALPWFEIALGAALAFGIFPRVTTSAAIGLMSIYTLLTAQAWWRSLPIECGCMDFSGMHPALAILSTPPGAALRNLFLLLITVAFAVTSFPKNTTD